MAENPIRLYRELHHLTLDEAANEARIHIQAFLLAEHGCYPRILPSIRRWMGLGSGITEADRQYATFQSEKRTRWGRILELADIDLDFLGAPGENHPITQFRSKVGLRHGYPNGISRMGFAKDLCLHPSELYLLENGRKRNFSEQLAGGLREAGLPASVVSELEYRSEEYVS